MKTYRYKPARDIDKRTLRYFGSKPIPKEAEIERENKYKRLAEMVANKSTHKLKDGRKLFYSKKFGMYILKAC